MATSGKSPERMWAALEQARTEHLTYEQLEAYVDSRAEADEAELVRSHTDLCPQCAAELRELTEFSVALRSTETSAVARQPRLGLARWLSIPRLVVAAAAIALIVVAVLPRQASRSAVPNGTTAQSGSRRVVEAVLPSESALVSTTSEETGSSYRVLTADDAAAYQKERAAAPDDPRARAAIAIKYSLFGIAEQDYRRMEAAGGKDEEDARQLLQQLQQLRGR